MHSQLQRALYVTECWGSYIVPQSAGAEGPRVLASEGPLSASPSAPAELRILRCPSGELGGSVDTSTMEVYTKLASGLLQFYQIYSPSARK
jgi:hypothetical protein